MLYNTIGQNYAQTRTSDPQIISTLFGILNAPPQSTVVDIGAGTGSYALALAKQDYRVLAVEPSATMRDQAIFHSRIEWIDGFAEHLPLPDQSADAAIFMLSFHHLQNYQQALAEACRVTSNGQIVLLTYDPDFISKFWLTWYFPALIADVQSTFLPMAELITAIEMTTNVKVNVAPCWLPHDLLDAFAGVGWARPELYLDGNIRSGISSFTKLSQAEIDNGVLQLRHDIKTGVWDQKHGDLRQQQQYDAGYRFVYTTE
jgi:SAM-dependent methyltransferase